MATRFYLRATTGNVGSFVRTEKSTTLPVGTLDDSGGAARDLSRTQGSTDTTQTNTSLAQTGQQSQYLGKWISEQLGAVGTLSAQTWTAALRINESAAAANTFARVSIYVLTSSDTVRGFVYDGTADLGTEVDGTGQLYTVSGSSVASIASTDRLVIEVWLVASQSMGSGYINTLFFDGPTAVTAGGTGGGSYVETPQDLFTQFVDLNAGFLTETDTALTITPVLSNGQQVALGMALDAYSIAGWIVPWSSSNGNEYYPTATLLNDHWTQFSGGGPSGQATTDDPHIPLHPNSNDYTWDDNVYANNELLLEFGDLNFPVDSWTLATQYGFYDQPSLNDGTENIYWEIRRGEFVITGLTGYTYPGGGPTDTINVSSLTLSADQRLQWNTLPGSETAQIYLRFNEPNVLNHALLYQMKITATESTDHYVRLGQAKDVSRDANELADAVVANLDAGTLTDFVSPWGCTLSADTTVTYDGGRSLKMNFAQGEGEGGVQVRVPLDGQTGRFWISAAFYGGTAFESSFITIAWYNDANSLVGSSTGPGLSAPSAHTWHWMEIEALAPAGATKVQITPGVLHDSAFFGINDFAYFDAFSIRKIDDVQPITPQLGGGATLGAAALSATATLVATGTQFALGATALSGEGVLAAAGTQTAFGAAALSATGDLGATAVRVHIASVGGGASTITPVAYSSGGTGAGSGTNFTVTAPTGTASGHYLLLGITCRSVTGWTSSPTDDGFALLETVSDSAGEMFIYGGFYGTEVTTTSWDLVRTATDKNQWSCVALSGVDATTEFLAESGQGEASTTVTNHSTPSISPADQAFLVAIMGDRIDAGSSWTWPSGWTERIDGSGSGTNAVSSTLATYDTNPASAGSYSVTATASVASSNAYSWIGALKPGGGAGGLTASATLAVTGETAVPGAATLSASATLAADGNVQLAGGAALSGESALAASGVLTALAASDLSATATLAAAAEATALGAAALSAEGVLLATGTVFCVAASALDATGDLVASGLGIHLASADLTGNANLTTDGVAVRTASAALDASGTLAATAGEQTVLGAAALSGSADLTAAGSVIVPAAAVLDATADLTASGVQTTFAAAALDATAALAASGEQTALAAAALDATATLAAAGVQTAFGASAHASSADLTVAGVAIQVGSAALDATATLVADGNAQGGSSATLSAESALAAAGVVSALGAAAPSASSSLTADSLGIAVADSALAATADLAASALATVAGAAPLTGSGDLTTSAVLVALAASDLAGNATLASDGTSVRTASSALSASATLDVTALATLFSTAPLDAQSDLVASGTLVWVGAAALSATGDLTASGTQTALAAAALTAEAGQAVAGLQEAYASAALLATANIQVDIDSTIYASASLSVQSHVGPLFGSGTFGHGAFGGPVAAIVIALGAASLSAQGDLAANGTHLALAAADLTGVADLAVSGVAIPVASAALTATADLTATGVSIAVASSALSATATLLAEIAGEVTGTATLSAEGSLAAAGIGVGVAAADLSGNSILTTDGTAVRVGAVSLEGSGTLATTALVEAAAAAALSAGAELVAAGQRAVPGAASFSSTADLTAAGLLIANALATLSADGSLGVSAQLELLASAALSANSSLLAATVTTQYGAAALEALTTGDATATIVKLATAALSAEGDVQAAAVRVAVALAALSGDAALTSSSLAVVGGVVTLEGLTSLLASGALVALSAADLEALATIGFGEVYVIPQNVPTVLEPGLVIVNGSRTVAIVGDRTVDVVENLAGVEVETTGGTVGEAGDGASVLFASTTS